MLRTSKAHEIPEITDLIFDQLDLDKRSLLSCALVCSDWASSARYRLFSTIHLRGRDSFRFLAFMQSPRTAHLCKYIQAVRWTEDDGDSLHIEDLCNVITSISQVHTLHLEFSRFSNRPTSYPFARVKEQLSGIKRLSVRYRLRLNKMERLRGRRRYKKIERDSS